MLTPCIYKLNHWVFMDDGMNTIYQYLIGLPNSISRGRFLNTIIDVGY